MKSIGRAQVLHRVEDSEWNHRFVEEGGERDLVHYLVVTGDDWVDVLAPDPPVVEPA